MKWTSLSIFLLPLGLGTYFFLTQPFQNSIAEVTYSTQGLNPAQKNNVLNAMKALEGKVIQPQQVFSFNETVGVRSLQRGYILAPSYYEGKTIQTLGGGVCFSSSILYQLALKAGFKIIERSPHQRSIHSVPLGLDATVWDHGADLKIKNTLKVPLLLHHKASPDFITLQLQGRGESSVLTIYTQPHTIVSPSGKVLQKVIVWRQMKGKSAEKISEDLYPEQ